MAGITLRAYIQEIEKQVESERLEEAIAHCRYILKAFPRYVDVYRLLGKAFLESQRYGDAADILQRVLSSVPEDFVSHVGMSIIREDEGNLDEAIWHMERAFEVQPGNSAIQDELRRLYGRRDGTEPPKIRLTRGALARLYYKGNLFSQAIAEIRVALAENPNRHDLQALLATIYAKTGQRAEAAETANALVRKLPNCLTAIQILAEMLANTDRGEEARSLSERLQQLDPYTAFINPQRPTPDLVPDNAVTIEKLDWKSSQAAITGIEQPGWATSLGVNISGLGPASQESLPEWLSEGGEAAPVSAVPAFSEDEMFEDLPTPMEPSAQEGLGVSVEEEIPEWMKAAGWSQSIDLVEEAEKQAVEGTEEPAGGEGELAAAEIPDWLRAMAPSEAMEAPGAEEDVSPWLDKLIPAEAATDIPDWPQQGEAVATAEPPSLEAAGPEETPDWLALGGAVAAGALAAEAKDRLSASQEPPAEIEAHLLPEAEKDEQLPAWLFESEEASPTEEPGVVAELLAAKAVTEAPEWLQEIPEESKPAEIEEPSEPPDWLSAVQEPLTPGEAPLVESIEEPFEAEPVEEIPAWLLESEEILPMAEMAEIPAAEAMEEVPEWLREIEAPVAAEPGVTEEAKEAEPEGIPDWLREIEEVPVYMEDTKPTHIRLAEETPAEPELAAAMPPEEGVPSSLEDADAAFAWLESLAIQQGASEALLLQPEERRETPPEWVQQAAAEEPPEIEEAGKKPVAVAAAILATSAEITALQEKDTDQLKAKTVEPAPPEPVLPTEPATPALDEDAAFAWLESLAVQQGASEALLLKPEERLEMPPEWVLEEAAEEAQPVIEEVLPVASPVEPAAEILAEALPEEEAVISEAPAVMEAPIEEAPAVEEILIEEAPAEVKAEEPGIEAVGEVPLEALAVGAGLILAEAAQQEEKVEEEMPVVAAELEAIAPAEVEQPMEAFEPAVAPAEAQVEELPELPDWLRTEPLKGVTDELEWPLPPVAPRKYDLNKASLAELERLPGIGFIMAQQIVNYREAHGSFVQVEDLLRVPGFTPESLAAVKDHLFVEVSQQAVTILLEAPGLMPVEGQAPAELEEARAMLNKAELKPALGLYARLIQSNQLLSQMVDDLEEVAGRHPEEFDVWLNLGDAHLRLNQVHDALQAYFKAEELLR